jgi:hypothetical protein
MQIPNEASRPSMMLLEAMKLCEGFSGRAMRKLPFIAHSHFVQVRTILHIIIGTVMTSI